MIFLQWGHLTISALPQEGHKNFTDPARFVILMLQEEQKVSLVIKSADLRNIYKGFASEGSNDCLFSFVCRIMAKILYAVCGIGVGHAIRSRVVIDLLRKNHEVMVMGSHHAYDYLREYYPKMLRVEGFEFVFKDNTLLNLKTFFKNLLKLNPGTAGMLETTRKKIDAFKPDLVISDMETYAMHLARLKKIPLITIDNQHFLLYGEYSFPKKYVLNYVKALLVVTLATRKAAHNIVVAFPGLRLRRKANATLIPPLLREEIVHLSQARGEYIFVYQSTATYKGLLKLLKKVNHRFVIYGFDLNKKEKNLEFRKFDDGKGFFNDLAGAKAVIANGGFTLLSEALYLQKPLLVVPIKRHFEQVLNGIYIKQRNLGECYEDLTLGNLVEFMRRCDANAYAGLQRWENEGSLEMIERIVNAIVK